MACIGRFKLAFFIVTAITMSLCYLFYFFFSLSQNFMETLIYKYCRILGKIQRTLEINYVTEIQNCYLPEVCFKCLLYYWWYPLTWWLYKSSIYVLVVILCYFIILLCEQHKKLYYNAITSNKKIQYGGPPAFKSQSEGYQSKQKLLHHYQHSTKISSIHKFILKIQWILQSHELKDHGHFWPCPPKNHWIYFQCSWICTNMQKFCFIPSVHFSDTVNFRV